MRKNTIGKFLCMPFIFIALPFLCIGLLIRYGLEDACDILEDFNEALFDRG